MSTPTVTSPSLTDAGPPPPAPAVRARGVRKAYDGRAALRGVDLDVGRGEVLALLGPNGAGKTTLIGVLEGFLSADAGEVNVLAEDPARAPRAWRERVGVVLQSSAAEPELTVGECLSLYAGWYSAPRDVDATLALVGLAERADRRGAALSGGERRRLDVAIALIGDPELVFLDEPTTGFDPAARRDAWDAIDSLRTLGVTIVLTTHHLEEAERLADRIVVLRDGRVLAEGTPHTLGGRDQAPARITFRAADGTPVELRSEHPAADLRRLLDAGEELDGLQVLRPTLEDTYLELTR